MNISLWMKSSTLGGRGSLTKIVQIMCDKKKGLNIFIVDKFVHIIKFMKHVYM